MDEETARRDIAFVESQMLCARIELEAMLAANAFRERQGLAQAYGEDAFIELLARYPIQHDDMLTALRRGI